jgi:hypothetical protein
MKDRKRRKKLREKLEAAGYAQDVIESIIEQRREEDRARRHEFNPNVYRYDPENDQGYYPDDTGYEPTPGDPLLRGAGRVDGVTAKVVRRKSTITKFQYDRLVKEEQD